MGLPILQIEYKESAPTEQEKIAQRAMILRKRFLAATLDLCVIQGFCLYMAPLLSYAFLLSHGAEFRAMRPDAAKDLFFESMRYGFFWIWGGSSILLWPLYSVISFCSFQKSLGTAVLGLKLVSKKREDLTLRELALRSLSFMASWVLLGIPLLPLLQKKKMEAWHDRFSGTHFELIE
jgi:uncharacterized RDD family membrane protein YckC